MDKQKNNFIKTNITINSVQTSDDFEKEIKYGKNNQKKKKKIRNNIFKCIIQYFNIFCLNKLSL